MFDVPVQAITVSLGSVSNSSFQASERALPQISSALLTAMAGSQPAELPAAILPTIAQTALPQNSFQSLEPLNLADATASLNQAFELSLPTVAAEAITLLPESVSKHAQADTQQGLPEFSVLQEQITADSLSIAPPISDQLRQCVAVDSPETLSATTFKVLLQGDVVGTVSSEKGPQHVVQALQKLLANQSFNADEIVPVLGNEQPAIYLSSDVLLRVVSDPRIDGAPSSETLNSEWAAIAWSDQLRQIMGASPLEAGDVQVMLKDLKPSEQQVSGLASWYGPYFHGRLTANGETFDQNILTAAHKTLPFNTLLKVRNLKNNRTVVVRINDRGPYIGKRSLDLSKAAAQCLGGEETGVIPYEAIILE